MILVLSTATTAYRQTVL